MHQLEELERERATRSWERTVHGGPVVVVDAAVLVVQRAVEDAAAQRFGVEHAGDKRFELDVAVVERGGDRAGELELIGLKTRCGKRGRCYFVSYGRHGAKLGGRGGGVTYCGGGGKEGRMRG